MQQFFKRFAHTLPAALAPLFPVCVGLLLSLGLLLPVLHTLAPAVIGTAVIACLATAAVCAVAAFAGRRGWLPLAVAGGAVLLYLVLGGGMTRLVGVIGALVRLLNGDMTAFAPHAGDAAAAAGVLLTLGAWAVSRQGAGFYPALSLSLVALLIVWFSGGREEAVLFAPALLALLALFGRSAGEETSAPRLSLAAALALALALLLMPLLRFTSPQIEDFASRIRNYITDTLFFTEPRAVYSIGADGYMPLDDRLGGPVELSDRPVMTVKTETAVLLRGTLYNEYNGLRWVDTLSTRRYLYSDFRRRDTRVNILDEERPVQSIRDATDLFTPKPVSVTMQSGSASTLFLPARAQALNMPMALVPYFNAAGELFVTRNLAPGDAYDFAAPVIAPDDPRLPGLLQQAQGEGRDMAAYLRLPNALAPDLLTLTQQITAGATTPLDTALAIWRHLRENYSYTLTPETPPDQQDFVSYFILRGQEGYCTYFASAMAVMGRIAGLPTRYVEGYAAYPSGGTALVRSEDAHAWAEVYFDGFGWIAFDATPPDGQGGGGESGQNPTDAPEEPNDNNDSSGGEPQPTPTADISQENTPSDSPQQNPEQNPQSAQTEPTSPPDSPDDPNDPNNPNDPPPDPTAAPGGKKASRAWLWLLLILLIAAAIALRAWWTDPRTLVSRRCKTDDDRLLVWYRALLGLLSAAGWPQKPVESPVGYALRIEEALPEGNAFLPVADAVTLLGYGRYGASPAQVQDAARCYVTLEKSLPPLPRVRWWLRRLARGVGSVRQVP
ncbi:MAG: transglutaminase domain-containing protein [Oscillospiraceae bacterium]|jgi:transglutaminase-like putative cysteine protease|nr:transglutaminase domain-containing protein [Oscillospiraceae bacterium]